jgi:hypothetical protein
MLAITAWLMELFFIRSPVDLHEPHHRKTSRLGLCVCAQKPRKNLYRISNRRLPVKG